MPPSESSVLVGMQLSLGDVSIDEPNSELTEPLLFAYKAEFLSNVCDPLQVVSGKFPCLLGRAFFYPPGRTRSEPSDQKRTRQRD